MKDDSNKTDEPSVNPLLVAELAAIKAKLSRVERATNFYAFPSVLFFLAFSLPIIGNLAAVTVGSWMGCSFGESVPEYCPYFGSDLAEVFYEYGISMFLLGMLNPLLFLKGLSIILTPIIAIIWIGSVVWLYSLRYNLRRRLWLTRVHFVQAPP